MILNPYAIVIDVYATLGGKQPGATSYADHKAYINANGQAAYLTALEGMFATQTNATMSATILANLGLASIFTAAQGEAYLAANAGNRVKAALDLASALTNYVSDATNTNDTAILAAKTTYVATTANAYTYASNSANTSDAATSAAAVSTGQTFTLTKDSVTGAFDNLTGTGGADSFSANADGLLATGDVLNGGEGADTLTTRHTVTADTTISADITDIETIAVRVDHDGAAADVFTFDMADVSGATRVTVDRAANSGATADAVVTLSGAGFTQSVATNITGGDTGADNSSIDVTATYTGATGTADSATLELNGAAANVVTINAIETLNIVASTDEVSASTTGASALNSLIAQAAKTVNISGAGAVSLSGKTNAQVAADLAATVTVNASTNTGGVSMTAEASTLNFTGGSGNDVVYMVGTLTSADTLVGGAGDLDRIGTTTATTLANGAGVSGFEILDISGAAGATFDLANFANNTFTGVAVTEETASETANNVVAGSTIYMGGLTAITATSDLTVGVKGAALAGRNSDSLNISVGGTAAVDFGTLTAASVESLTIAAGGATTGNSIAVLTAAAATDLVLTGASALEITAFTSSAALTNIDASAMTGAFVMGAAGAATGATSLKGGAGADTLLGNAGADVIIGNAGIDSIAGGAGGDDMTGGAGADIFTIAPGTTNTAGSVAASATSLTATIATGDTMTFGNGVDIIRDFVSGTDQLKVSDATATLEGVLPTALIGATAGDIAEDTVHGSKGTFVESTGVFTLNTTGNDYLLTINDGTNADDVLSTNTNVIILIGSATAAANVVAADLV